MSRVWKYFFISMAKGFALACVFGAYGALIAAIGISQDWSSNTFYAVYFGSVLFLLITWITWGEAKSRVERENKSMINEIKG